MSEDNLIVGMLKVKNEVQRGGNIYRAFQNLSEYCDDIFAVDDGSVDGTYEYLKSQLPEDHIIRIDPEIADFSRELEVKQQLLEKIHENGPWKWIFWLDADEVLDAEGTTQIRDWCRNNLTSNIQALSFHYLQIWVNSSWYRLDSQFNDGWFIKLWRYNPNLRFDIIPGTHHAQFPAQIAEALGKPGAIEKSKFEVIHYGNYKTALKHKAIQYANGLGGVDRHIHFEQGEFAPMDKTKYPNGAEYNPNDEPKPEPYTPDYIEKLLKLNNLTNLKDTFCIILPTYNRCHTLGRAIDSILKQTYQNWVLFVLDDSSTDNTNKLMEKAQDLDPRIFYCRYLKRGGGVAMNEIGMEIAINTCEWWSRMGSDDFWEPNKLELDVKAFELGYNAVYGCFQVIREGKLAEVGNYPVPAEDMVPIFLCGGFFSSWASVAVKCSVLRDIKELFGDFCNKQLQNMEDLQFNHRVARLTDWIWRGYWGNKFTVNPTREQMNHMMEEKDNFAVEGYWNANQIGASANTEVYSKDQTLSIQLILKDSEKFKTL